MSEYKGTTNYNGNFAQLIEELNLDNWLDFRITNRDEIVFQKVPTLKTIFMLDELAFGKSDLEPDVVGYKALAERQRELGHYDKAIQLAKESKSVDVLAYVARLCLDDVFDEAEIMSVVGQINDPQLVVGVAERLKDASPVTQGIMCELVGESQRAKNYFREAYQDWHVSNLGRGEIAERAGDFIDAIESYIMVEEGRRLDKAENLARQMGREDLAEVLSQAEIAEIEFLESQERRGMGDLAAYNQWCELSAKALSMIGREKSANEISSLIKKV